MSPWSFRCVWPVEDEGLGYKTAVSLAEAELDELAGEAGAKLVGPVEWSMVEHDHHDAWPHTPLALVAVAEAVPANPTREQWPALVRYYAGQRLNDRQIARELGVPRDSVIYVRRKHNISAGVPAGYRSAEQIAEPKWPAA